jgi:hypothetical protein
LLQAGAECLDRDHWRRLGRRGRDDPRRSCLNASTEYLPPAGFEWSMS